MLRWQKPGVRRKLCLVLPIVFDLSLLALFKYFSFSYELFSSIASTFRLHIPPLTLHIVLPIGISFYTFHTISYMVDSYRGTIKPTTNFFEFSCYVSLFS
jgi:D-alanyl-lipoteichoic acid acyltransferase DltB (MBOAT superfamily)